MFAAHRFCCALLLALAVLTGGKTALAASKDPLVAILRAAKQKALGQSKEWLRLGHWRKGLFGGYTSEADGEGFFLAPEGKTDPDAELEATLRGFFIADWPSGSAFEHPLCRFPARLMWLTEELNLDLSQIPARKCTKLEEFWTKTRPKSATLVFSSYYLNNPASAFGHTFLRINRDDPYAVGERRDLLDYGVDYSATVDTGNAIIYALKGLTGQFPGRFNIYPYFYKVREYNDYESRDLWEYNLSLDRRQVTLLTLHLWELGSTYFAYYYMTENCSYHIMGALEVANPELDLLRYVKSPVVPADTVKALYRSPGLVRNVHYRPSVRSQFRLHIANMDAASLSLVDQLGRDPELPFPSSFTDSQARVRVLDASLDLVDFRYAKDILKSNDSAGARLKQRLLERRAEIRVPSIDQLDERARERMPQDGHDSGRIGLAFGASTTSGRSGFYELGYRLALHDLSDPPRGYPELSQIEFLPMRLRLWPKERSLKALQIEDFSLIEVRSLTPYSRFEHSFSWKVRAGGTRLRDNGCNDCFAAVGEFGAGSAFSFGSDALTFFGLLNTSLLISPPLDGIGGTPFRFGVGPWGGTRLRFSQRLIALALGSIEYLPAQSTRSTWSARGTVSWLIGPQVALALEGGAQPKAGEMQLTSRLYF